MLGGVGLGVNTTLHMLLYKPPLLPYPSNYR